MSDTMDKIMRAIVDSVLTPASAEDLQRIILDKAGIECRVDEATCSTSEGTMSFNVTVSADAYAPTFSLVVPLP